VLSMGEVLSFKIFGKKMHVSNNLCILDNMLENELKIHEKKSATKIHVHLTKMLRGRRWRMEENLKLLINLT